ncbi:hypothetical protein A4H97_11620 [Niastella yeongjuensis]|uniref:Fibronectin type-III domain-containing protein n=1 Tax=Niastella yeongjuensis TaxID=354355 RepID=A0A1V9E9P1_9BACT|nr:fibronectin type III domain-containing protein [Niastella yeongjuensis]OQP42802.1 hypothetical protein A4H97_11620 [Niastella yeongjuensis]SEO54740.1 hypothetical protein SAMN05660816_02992 [Niastella yeongjuensis]
MSKSIAKYKKRQGDIAMICQRVIENMENNPAFPTPPAALTELKKLLPEYQAALVKAGSRDKQMVSVKNDKKVLVLAYLKELAEYVTVTCNGDRTLILSSGFDVANDARDYQTPAIEILEVEMGAAGEATTHAKNVSGILAYVHQYTKEQPGINTEWIGIGSSQSSHTFEGLISDKRYWFRVVAIGTNGRRSYSPVVTRVIQ